MNLTDLAAPFKANEIEWRVSRAGKKANGDLWAKILAYVTNRAIQDRLDSVCGPENWQNVFREWQGGGAVICGISVKIKDEWVIKYDGSENTDIEAVKGGFSGSQKRAAVQWGIGRYLYQLEETWANIHDTGTFAGQFKDKQGGMEFFKYDPPALPGWALPKGKINPTTGAKESLTPEQIILVDRVANSVIDWLTSGSVADAVQAIENANFSAEEKTYCWTLFDSKQRAAMKKEHQRLKEAA